MTTYLKKAPILVLMSLTNKLIELGLPLNEVKVFLCLVKNGEMSANEIARKTRINRSLAYSVVNNLLHKGYVGYVQREKLRIYSASDPSCVLSEIQKKKMIADEVFQELQNIKKAVSDSCSVRVLEGRRGLRAVMNQFIEGSYKSLSCYGATGRAYSIIHEAKLHAKTLIRRKIKARFIAASEYRKKPLKLPFIEVRYTESSFDTTISIFGDYVVIHYISDDIRMVVIKDSKIAKCHLSFFDSLWNSLGNQ